VTETGIPQRVKLVKGHFAPEFPGECEPHTDSPDGYLGWDEWAEQKTAAGYVQRQCRGCGLWAIWERPAPAT
jgi:hypothetical protein